MKIGIYAIENLATGKVNLFDSRLDTLKQMLGSGKRVYIQIELISDAEKLKEADGILCPETAKSDLILTDLEFVEGRFNRAQDEKEKNLLTRFKEQLEKEAFISELVLNEEAKRIISGFSLLTAKPIFLAKPEDLEDENKILLAAYNYFGYICFFTANEKEAHSWSIKKGTTAWEAAGYVHSDIQRGFIRAEVVSFQDLINDRGLNQARANNHLRLEGKDYIVQDADLINFRFSK